jgi:hypothetical protein
MATRIEEGSDGQVQLYSNGGTCLGAIRVIWDDDVWFEALAVDGVRLGVFGQGIVAVAALWDAARSNGGAPVTITAPQDRRCDPEFKQLVKKLGLEFELPGAEAYDDVPDALFDKFWCDDSDVGASAGPDLAPEPPPEPEAHTENGGERDALEVHICAQCRLNPPDGSERPSAYNGAWLHPGCKEAFIRARMAEEGVPWKGPNGVRGERMMNVSPLTSIPTQ